MNTERVVTLSEKLLTEGEVPCGISSYHLIEAILKAGNKISTDKLRLDLGIQPFDPTMTNPPWDVEAKSAGFTYSLQWLILSGWIFINKNGDLSLRPEYEDKIRKQHKNLPINAFDKVFKPTYYLP